MAAVLLLVAVAITCCGKSKATAPETTAPETPPPPETSATSRHLWDEQEEEAIIKQIQMKFKRHELELLNTTTVGGDGHEASIFSLEPHQFLHLHHMKTGGTSMDHLLKCAMDRLRQDYHWEVPYHNIHECQRGKFRRCLQNATNPCRDEMKEAGIMSYCAPLEHLGKFGWLPTAKDGTVDPSSPGFSALTVLRHPVERVWSMFRFETKLCYKCKNLTDIYQLIDNRKTDGLDSLCLRQLQNKQVHALLSSNWTGQDEHDPQVQEAMLQEAVENLKTVFTVVGLTEQLPATIDMVHSAFPWLQETIPHSDIKCYLPHENKSPQNNYCIRVPDGKPGHFSAKHWDLPDAPDEKTKEAIIAHNGLDLRLYEAAIQYFEIQKRALALGEEE